MEDLAEDVTDKKPKFVPRPHTPPPSSAPIATRKSSDRVQAVYQAFVDVLKGPSPTVDSVRASLKEPQKVKLETRLESVRVAKMKPGHLYQHLVDLKSKDHFKKYGSGVRFKSTVNHPKIEIASEKRAGEHIQGVVMRASANDVSALSPFSAPLLVELTVDSGCD